MPSLKTSEMEFSNTSISRGVLVKGFLIIIAVLTLTQLRPFLFILMPLIILGFLFSFKIKFTQNILIIGLTIILNTILASLYVGEINFSNNLLSIYFIFPLIIIFFGRIEAKDKRYLTFFISLITIILFINNCVGFVQYFIGSSVQDDAFVGFYGTHGLGLHVLSLVNYLVGVYYFMKYEHEHLLKYLLLSMFFIISAILSFYGLGLIMFLISIFAYQYSLRNLFRSIMIFAFAITLFGTMLFLFKKQTFFYNLENIKRTELFFEKNIDEKDLYKTPRKLLLFRNYMIGYSKNAGIFLLGSGPGTFNSRTYFLLNGEYSRSRFLENILGTHNPKMATKYVHPFWNNQNTGMYMDGTRNQPFSSIIALLAEYGFLIFTLMVIMVYSKYSVTLKRVQQDRKKLYLARYLKFASIFMAMNLFTDNFLEYPEIMFIYLLIFKLIEISVKRERTVINAQ